MVAKLLQISSRNELKPLIQILNVRKLLGACMVLLALPLVHCLLMHFLIGLQFNLSYKASSRKRKRRIEGLFLFFSPFSAIAFKTEYIVGYIQNWQDHALWCICMYRNWVVVFMSLWVLHISSRIHFKCFKGKTYIYLIYFYIIVY